MYAIRRPSKPDPSLLRDFWRNNLNRDLLDQGVCIFMRYYKQGNKQLFDLSDLGKYLYNYQALIDFWKKRLPNPVFEVRYAAFAYDPYGYAEKLYRFLSLDWHPGYLKRLQDNAKYVSVLSPHTSLEIPTPVCKDFIGIGQRFKHQLEPLLDGWNQAG